MTITPDYAIIITSIIIMAFAAGVAAGLIIAADRTLAALKGGAK